MTKIEPPANEPLTMRILISYHYFQDVNVGAMIRKLQDLSGIEKMDVFADSGAFTAQSQGVHIELSEYVEWIHKWEEYLTVYLNLDVIGNQEGTNANQETLENKFGVHPVPVFTFQWHGSDYDTLAWQLDKYEYISLGGMVPFMGRPKAVMPHLIKCFKMAGDRTVFHGLGCTNWTIMNALPFYSVDSSSWVGGVRYGNLSVFDEHRGRWKRFQLGKPRSFFGAERLFAQYGYDYKEFVRRDTQKYHDVAALQGLSYMAAERWLRKRHGLIHLPSGTWPKWGAINPKRPHGQVAGETKGKNETGAKIYLANIVDYLYDSAAEQCGKVNAEGAKIYLAGGDQYYITVAANTNSMNQGFKLYLASTTDPDRFQAAAGGVWRYNKGGLDYGLA